MDYKETRELLLHAEALSIKQAKAILDLWDKNPRTYSDFLRNRGSFTFLSTYVGVGKDNKHGFIQTTKRVPSPEIAEKFFRLEEDNISVRLIDIITDNVCRQDADISICAFPYLNKECVQYMSREFILEMFLNALFIFNFEEDTTGSIFEMMYQRVGGEQEKELLAVNSFNIDGWVVPRKDPRKTAKMFLMSEHFTQRCIGEEAGFRKLFLRYIYDIQEGMRQIDEKLKREQGIFLN